MKIARISLVPAMNSGKMSDLLDIFLTSTLTWEYKLKSLEIVRTYTASFTLSTSPESAQIVLSFR